ncbi:Non-reducing end beta-L-arabinofuranosidase [Posidoniimonas polymericola]|uniref:Non-reducing end beta-L-arabinofuranosidase n=1 Tax=Posidoniimonas polymericola TaxID=2528002 RepID=A0A5C5YRP2_9BACT|nr:glycoside hydrolase family 127 protein [Posidoniimonas polymericola]TWT77586.1 Non-reducing end beta-L-arabinofuranosidase [Posidoniimonas polymericola]
MLASLSSALGLTLLFSACVGAAEPVLPIADTTTSPHAVLRPIGVEQAQWTDGFWAERYRVCRERSIPTMGDIMESGRYKPFLGHFLIAAGQAEGDYHGAAWNDGDFYKWIEAACAMLAVEPNGELRAAVDRSVRAIVAAQRDDGYLHTPVLIRAKNGDPTAQPLSDRHDFEVYNMGHLMTTGCVHYRVTGSTELLDAAKRAAGFLERAFANPTPEIARNSVCPSHYMGAVELYRTTGDQRYLRLAEHFLAMRDLITDGGDDNQDRVPFLEQREAVGHAVRANYLYAGVADLLLETGDPRLRGPLDAVWRNVTEKKLYVTGACGALYDGASPDGSAAQGEITRTHQAYGRNYQLPNTTAHNETCAALGAVFWNWRMLLATGEAKHADWIELAMHNAVLSGVGLAGDDYLYVNPLRRLDPEPADLRWRRSREPFIVSFCCPPNVVRTLAELSGYAYSKSDDALWVHLYGANKLSTELAGGRLRVTQQTDYPWDGAVTLTIDECPNAEFALALRIPGWCDGATLQVNDEETDATADANGYASIRRRWKPGDTVKLDLPMPVVLLESNPRVEETRNQLAVKRGPVVYCLEAADLPAGVRVDQLALPADAELTPRFEPDLLGGVTTITTDLLQRDQQAWSSLYRPASADPGERVKAKLVPYYAWGNRGPGEMSVWLPRD